MQTHLEIEFKILLTKDIYTQLSNDYQDQIIEQYEQTNYYLMHPILDQKHYMLRIREKNKTYELTLKQPRIDGNLETNIVLSKEEATSILHKQYPKNIIFEKLLTLGIPLQDLDNSNYLKTLRTDIQLPSGMLSLDKNTYKNTTDYELELEVTNKKEGEKAFLQLLQKYHLSYQRNCLSKIKRLKQSL